MEEKFKIADSEWHVMKIIWENERITAGEIIDKLSETCTWKPKTVKTLISRLLNKEIIYYEKKGKEYVYYSNVSKEECITTENESFLKKVYNGAVKNMLVSFLEEYKLSKEDIKDLKNLLEDKEKEN